MTKTKTLQDAALTFLANGFSLIPVRRDKKKSPALEVLPGRKWKQFQKEPATEEQVKEWFASGEYNIGIICGEVSGNLVVIDFDKPSEFELIKDQLPETWIAQSGREGGGYHVYFRSDSPHPSYRLAEKNVEIRAEGNYVVAPPSIHFSGTTYKFLKRPKQIAAMPSLTALGLAKTDKTSDTKEREPNWVTKTMAGPVYESTLNVPEGALSGRDVLCTKLAGHFLRLLPKDEVELILTAWGQTKCIPPFSTGDVLKCVNSIDQKRGGEQGELESFTLDEIIKMDIPLVPEIISNIVAPGQFTLLVGSGGVGKSSIALPAGIAAAAGENFLGFEVPEPVTTLYVDLEMGIYEFQLRAKRLAEHYGELALKNFRGLSVADFRINQEGNFARFARLIEKTEPKLLIIDNHARFHSGDPNSERDMYDMIFIPVGKLLRDYNMGCIYIMHTPWKERDRPRGSIAAYDSASIMISIVMGGSNADNRVLKWAKDRTAAREKVESITAVYHPLSYLVERADSVGVSSDVLQGINWPIGKMELNHIFQTKLNIGENKARDRIDTMISKGDLVYDENSTGKSKKITLPGALPITPMEELSKEDI